MLHLSCCRKEVHTRSDLVCYAVRGEDLQSISTPGLFPAGEGAGYAGGIVSAAVDGLKVGRAVAAQLLGQSEPQCLEA